MKKFDVVMLSLMAGVLLLGAKGCSDCDKKKATAIAVCQASGAESQECKDAQKAAEEACAPVVNPTPEPTPTPPGVVCQEGQFCGCYHNPTGEQWLLATCPAGQECNDAKQCVTPPPTTCVPPCAADEKCVERGSAEKYYECVKIPGPVPPGLIPDEELTAVPNNTSPSQMWAETDAAIKRWRALHPEKWNAAGTCLVSVSGIDEAFLGISTELARQSIKAGQSITQSGQRSDCVFVNRTGTKLYEEMHVFEYARACAATGPNAYKGLYLRAESEQPPVGACSDPVTPKVDRFNLKRHNRINDSTPLFYNRETARWDGSTVTGYCDKIGFTDRLHCPARNECPGYKCEERVACETLGVSGKYDGKPLWRSDGTVNLTENMFQATCSNCTWLEICAADGTACKRCETEDGLCKVL